MDTQHPHLGTEYSLDMALMLVMVPSTDMALLLVMAQNMVQSMDPNLGMSRGMLDMNIQGGRPMVLHTTVKVTAATEKGMLLQLGTEKVMLLQQGMEKSKIVNIMRVLKIIVPLRIKSTITIYQLELFILVNMILFLARIFLLLNLLQVVLSLQIASTKVRDQLATGATEIMETIPVMVAIPVMEAITALKTIPVMEAITAMKSMASAIMAITPGLAACFIIKI